MTSLTPDKIVPAPESEADEATLVALAKRDRQAFAPLYARYFDLVYGYCYTRLGGREAAEDATGLIFARALSQLATCRDTSFRSWLFAIAHNVISDCFRRHRAEPSLSDVPDQAEAGPSVEDLAIVAEQRQTLHALLQQLPTSQRRVIELRLTGLSCPEVAQILGRSPTAVRSLQFRAVIRLRQLLGRDVTEKEADYGLI